MAFYIQSKSARKMSIFIIIISTMLSLSYSPASDTLGWRGIAPLRSKRADVEAMFGQATGAYRSSYYLKDMNLFFDYSSGNCENGGSGDWNIDPDTVIWITIYPKIKPKLSDLNVDESKFEKRQYLGDSLLYVNAEEGLSMSVDDGTVMSFVYGPTSRDETLRCPGYDGVYYSSSLPKELRPRLLERLNQYAEYSFTMQYEKQYELYLPEFAAKMFLAKNKNEFGNWVRSSGAFKERWIEFKPKSITETNDKNYGKVYEVFGLVRVMEENGNIVESYQKTRIKLIGKEWYFVDLFWLIPL